MYWALESTQTIILYKKHDSEGRHEFTLDCQDDLGYFGEELALENLKGKHPRTHGLVEFLVGARLTNLEDAEIEEDRKIIEGT